MKKLSCAMLIILLLIPCQFLLVNAAPVPIAPTRIGLTLPIRGSQNMSINFTQGTYITGNVDISNNTKNFVNIVFRISAPSGAEIMTDCPIIGSSFSFVAPETGAYMFVFNDHATSTSSKPIMLSYTVASNTPMPTNGITFLHQDQLDLLWNIIKIVGAIAVWILGVTAFMRRARAHAEKRKSSE